MTSDSCIDGFNAKVPQVLGTRADVFRPATGLESGHEAPRAGGWGLVFHKMESVLFRASRGAGPVFACPCPAASWIGSGARNTESRTHAIHHGCPGLLDLREGRRLAEV
jgi:hypothetical protein